MTSKEKLTSLVSALEIIGETKIKEDVVKQYTKDIEKDLEILEILREGFVREGRIITYKGFNQKNWDKVEEWLENGK